ncbi:hypothetical protein D3C80_2094230 [compost metagenome]
MGRRIVAVGEGKQPADGFTRAPVARHHRVPFLLHRILGAPVEALGGQVGVQELRMTEVE